MTEPLPSFRYHPDPLRTGSVAPSGATCRRCARARGHVYTGPVYAKEDLHEALCPWCIADGSAAAAFDAAFTDADGIGGDGDWDEVPAAVVEEVAERTPGFGGWQQERWWTHCRDAGEFLGRAGRAELAGAWADAVPALQRDAQLTGAAWAAFAAALDAGGSPCAYVFRCRHCAQLGGYSDAD